MKTILSKIHATRNLAGSTLYTNEITEKMDAYFLDLKDPKKAMFGGVVLFEPVFFDEKWTIGIKIPGAICGEFKVKKEGEGTLSSIWLIEEITTDGEICFASKRFDARMYFMLQEYKGDKLILPKDNTKVRNGA